MNLAAFVLLLTLFQNAPPPPPIRVEDPSFDLLRLQALANQPQQPVAPATVEGVVVEMPSGRPLAGATVRLQARAGVNSSLFSASLFTTSTRADGTFIFRNVPPGTHVLEADLGGYIVDTWGNQPPPRDPVAPNVLTPLLQLAPGQTVTGAQLQLIRGAVISGRLIDERGEPVVGAAVQAMKTTYFNGLRQRTLVQTAIANDLGEYRLFMLRPGQYHLSVVSSGETSLQPFREARAIPFYFPGTINSKEAQPIELSIGEERSGVTFSSIPARTRRITGTIQGTTDPAGVVLSPLNGTTSMEKTATASDGSFEFTDVVAGAYTLVARTINFHSAIPLDVRNADMLNVPMLVGPGFRIPVNVHIEGHGPGDDPELDTLYFNVRSEPAVPGLDAENYSPFPDGHFTLDVLGREYRIDLTRPSDYYVKSMTLGGVDVLNQGLHVTGSTDTKLEILVSKETGTVTGHTDGRIATVVLVPDAARRGQRVLYRSMKIGGTFRFDKVPPGDYKLFAWAEENGGPWLEQEYLSKYEDRGIPIHVDGGKTTTAAPTIPIL